MDARERRRNTWKLAVLLLPAVACIALLSAARALTGSAILDGSIGLVLGLYICSHPAANAVNMLIFERHILWSFPSKRSFAGWLALNLLVLAAGWGDIVVGASHFMDKGVVR